MLRHNWKHPEEADEAWSLQESVAFVITAPGSLYNPSRSDYHQRWDKLAKRFLEELESAQTKQLPINSSNVSRQHYATAPWATGGMFPEMTDVLTLFKSVNDVIQGLSGWLDLAALVGLLPRAWGRAQAAEGEGSEGGSSLPPLPSLPGIKAVCIADLVRNVGIQEMPQIAIDSRHFGRGAPDHPTWESRYSVLARMGNSIPQTFLYLLSGAGEIVEKMRIDTDEAFGIWFLSLPARH